MCKRIYKLFCCGGAGGGGRNCCATWDPEWRAPMEPLDTLRGARRVSGTPQGMEDLVSQRNEARPQRAGGRQGDPAASGGGR